MKKISLYLATLLLSLILTSAISHTLIKTEDNYDETLLNQNFKAKLQPLNQQIETIQLENQTLQKRVWFLEGLLLLLVVSCISFIYHIKLKNSQYKKQMYKNNIIQKEQLLTNLSHEFKTPLSVLKLHIEALEHNLIEDRFLAFGKINDKISQLNKLISDVYQSSKCKNNDISVNYKLIKLSEICQKFISDITVMANKHHLTLIKDIDINSKTFIEIDLAVLTKIIAIITENACFYTNVPGHIRFKVREEKHRLLIQIDDSAPSVNDEDLPKLCDQLFRTEQSRSRKFGGSGMGLALCKNLINTLNGSLELCHGELGGLCVSILLPFKAKGKSNNLQLPFKI